MTQVFIPMLTKHFRSPRTRRGWLRLITGRHDLQTHDDRFDHGVWISEDRYAQITAYPKRTPLLNLRMYVVEGRLLKLPAAVFRVKKETQTDIFREKFYSYFGTWVGMLFMVLFLSSGLCGSAHAIGHNTVDRPVQRFSDLTLGAVDITRVRSTQPFDGKVAPVPQVFSTFYMNYSLDEYYRTVRLERAVQNLEKAVGDKIAKLRQWDELRTTFGLALICLGIIGCTMIATCYSEFLDEEFDKEFGGLT